ncbi:GNAT family N-acetyltransferase [Yoonia sp. GPGPB17]|uniref:GNAT family N-acetyltransferase n=1 Tax=Yoonia sp. GPGPB17 TaxID=3026147 RepID=UPI0030C62B3C
MFVGKRLLLRNWAAKDRICLDAILGDPEVMQFSDTGALGKPDQLAWLHNQLSHVSSYGLPGNLAVELKETGHVIGYVSLSRDLARVSRQDAEIGIRLARSSWGHGYAAEAIRTLIDAVRPTDRIVAIVDPHNHRSLKLLRSVGLIYDSEIMFAGCDYADHLYTLG